MTQATRNTPEVVAPTTSRAIVNVTYSGAKAASIPKTTCITSDIKNIGFRPYLQLKLHLFNKTLRIKQR